MTATFLKNCGCCGLRKERQREHCRFVGRPGGEKREGDERHSRPLRPSTHNQCYRAEHLYRGGQNSPNFRVRKAFRCERR